MTQLLFEWRKTTQLLFEYLPSLYQQTPLVIAAKEGYEYTVKYLIENGADASMTDNGGVSFWKVSQYKITLVHSSFNLKYLLE